MRIRHILLALLPLSCVTALFAFQSAAPKLDKPKIEAYLRYAESFTSGVKMTIDDPTPSPYAGYFRLVVHLTMGPQQADRVYYVTADGERIVNGAIWKLNETPFLDTLEHLTTDGPSFGPTAAKVTVVVFSDFECPYCREFAKTVRDNVPQKYPNDVRVIFKNFPIEAIHKWAREAAEVGSCLAAEKSAAFWAFHDWIFEHQQEANDNFEHQHDTFDKFLKDRALAVTKEQNANPEKVASCLETHASTQQVDKDLKEGRLLQVQQTPTLFVNGRTIGGAVPWATLDSIIQIELNRPKEIAEPAPAGKCCEIEIPTIVKK